MPHSTPTPTAALHLHLVPAGHRLDFQAMPGYFAYIYRRQGQQPWQCVARNACSPYFDQHPLLVGSRPEYVVCYCDAAGTIQAASPIVASPASSISA